MILDREVKEMKFVCYTFVDSKFVIYNLSGDNYCQLSAGDH